MIASRSKVIPCQAAKLKHAHSARRYDKVYVIQLCPTESNTFIHTTGALFGSREDACIVGHVKAVIGQRSAEVDYWAGGPQPLVSGLGGFDI
jgi:hypothetical protein